MAKKSHIKVRLVPESKPDSSFFYYVKKPTKGEKAKNKLKLTKYNPSSLPSPMLKPLFQPQSTFPTLNSTITEIEKRYEIHQNARCRKRLCLCQWV